MASENAADPRANNEREPDHDHSVTPPSQQNGPSPFNDGPELLRDNHC
jgi:hypothetical protein